MADLARSESGLRRATSIACGLALAVGAAVVAWSPGERADPPTAAASTSRESGSEPNGSAGVESPRVDVRAGADAQRLPGGELASADEPPPATGIVVLRAYDVATSARLTDFTWTATGTVRGLLPRGEARGEQAQLVVPLRTAASVVLEREGYFASLPVDVALHQGTLREVRAALVPRPRDEVVRVVARDESGRPVPRLVARCRSRGADREGASGYAVVYELTSVAASGLHELPLPPEGWCRLALSPYPGDGDARILQSEVLEFRHARARAVEREVAFAAGGRIVVEAKKDLEALRLLDAHGRNHGVAMVPEVVRDDLRTWRSAEALPAGDYAIGYGEDGATVTRAFHLARGQELRLAMP